MDDDLAELADLRVDTERRHRLGSLHDLCPAAAVDQRVDVLERADRRPLAGGGREFGRGRDLRSHRAGRQVHRIELGRGRPVDPCLGRLAPVAVDAVDVGRHHEQVRIELAREQAGREVLVDDRLDADELAVGVPARTSSGCRRRRRR